MIALIDGDIVSYSCAVYNEDFGWEACKEDIDQLLTRILETTGATGYELFITGDNNFRYKVDPLYKANRKGKPDPIYRADANTYLVTEYGASVTDGYEADDAMGIRASQLEIDNRMICSIDKDLMQIEGHHFNWRKREFTEVSILDGTRLLYRQLLTGDTADNVPPVGGIGAVKSKRLIDPLDNERDMLQTVRALYRSEERLIMSGRLLYIWRKENDDWRIKYNQLMTEINAIDTTERGPEETPPLQE
jgi:5'-3' exonuclease